MDGDRRGINLAGQAFIFKLRGVVGATEPSTNPRDEGSPFVRGAFIWRGVAGHWWTEKAMPMDAVFVLTVAIFAFGGIAAALLGRKLRTADRRPDCPPVP